MISDSPADPAMASIQCRTSAVGRPSHISPARLVFRTGLIVSVGLTFIAFLDHRTTNMVIFGFLSVVFFFLLLRVPASRRRRRELSGGRMSRVVGRPGTASL